MLLLDYFVTFILSVCISMPTGYLVFSQFIKLRRRILKNRYIRKLEDQLPALLDSISSNLAVGKSLQQSIETASENVSTSLETLLKAILHRVRSGMTLDASLEFEGMSLPSGSLSLALLSMASSYRSGSNMIESLSLLSNLCRERAYLRRKIIARTAQSRTQGYILILVPIFFMTILFFVSPHNMIPVLKTTTGQIILGAAATLQCLGAITINAMLKQEIL